MKALGQTVFGFPQELIGLVLMVVAVVVIFFVSRALRRKADPLEKPPSAVSLQQQRSVERSLETLMIEMTETSRQLIAKLETRAAKLHALIDEADAACVRLRIANGQPSSEDARAALEAQVERATPLLRRKLPEDGQATSDAEHSEDEPHAAEPPARRKTKLPDNQAKRIYELADQGLIASQIAAELNRPSGEVEVVLGLRPR